VVLDLIDPGGDYDDPALSIRVQHMLPRVREMSEKASRLGVKIAAGTDTTYGPKSTRRVPNEIAELVKIGMSPMDAIKAGTSVSAECLGIAARTGSIEPGKEADLIVIERNPLTFLSALQDVLMVINDGTVVVNRLKW
jgi:imidazolonepropionase-like amidohydrolase